FSCALAATPAVLACTAMAQTRTGESFACREAERRYELIKSEITTVQLNATLFAASDKGCEALARALLAAGASLEARDRLGAMPLTYAARSGRSEERRAGNGGRGREARSFATER